MIQRKPDTAAVLIVAAGTGSRMGEGAPKQYRPLAGRPVLRRTVEAFLAAGFAPGQIQVVIAPGGREACAQALAGLALPAPVEGGKTRQESVFRGLEALASRNPETVLIHDAVRPFADAALIGRVLAALAEGAGGAIPAIPVTDTVKTVDGTGRVTATPDRSAMMLAQTPQGFRFQAIMEAHRRFAAESCTDDAALAERAGLTVRTVAGSEANRKLTTPADWQWAEGRFPARTATGLGTDVHAFGDPADGAAVWLGGVEVPYERPLLGHSDADVILHALVDAVLGILAEGDIGMHFPPSDPQWKGAPSRRFVAYAAERLAARAGRVQHVDITVLAEAPKLSPHRDAIRRSVAEMLGLPLGAVGLKATTTEGLGFIGRGEGIAAQALVTATLPEETA